MFNTYILGDKPNVAVASHEVTQISDLSITAGDFESLARYLQAVGIEAEDIARLQGAVGADAKVEGKPALGQRVQTWMGAMMGKAASGAWTVGTSAAGSVLGKAIARYYGLE